MLGLGETDDEMRQTLTDLRKVEFGFDYCASGPMVRSSYKAAENYILAQKNRLEV